MGFQGVLLQAIQHDDFGPRLTDRKQLQSLNDGSLSNQR
jgi:hypothetical protein